MLSQSLLQFQAQSKVVIPEQKKNKKEGTKRQHFSANACKDLRNKQVEEAKVFEFTEENIEFGRWV